MNIITPEAILSYANLFSPRAVSEDADPKYSVSLVFEEDADLTELKKAVIGVAKERWGEDAIAGAQLSVLETQHGPANFLVNAEEQLRIRIPWNDDPDKIASKGYPEGSTYVNARSTNPPGVVSRIADPHNDGKPAPIVNASGDVRYSDGTVVSGARPVYSGVIGRGLLSVYAYSNSGNNGVTFGLSGVQVIEDGERLDGRARAEDEFDADMDTADLSDLQEDGGDDGDDDLSDLIG